MQKNPDGRGQKKIRWIITRRSSSASTSVMATLTLEFRPEDKAAAAAGATSLLLVPAAEGAEPLSECPCRFGGHVVNPDEADALASSIRVANLPALINPNINN